MWKEFNSHRIFLVHTHGPRFIVLYTSMAAVTPCENDLSRDMKQRIKREKKPPTLTKRISLTNLSCGADKFTLSWFTWKIHNYLSLHSETAYIRRFFPTEYLAQKARTGCSLLGIFLGVEESARTAPLPRRVLPTTCLPSLTKKKREKASDQKSHWKLELITTQSIRTESIRKPSNFNF